MNLRERLEAMKDAAPFVNTEWLLGEMRKEGIGEVERWIGTREAALILGLSDAATRNLAARCDRMRVRGQEPEIRVRKKGGTDRSHWEMVEADVHRKRRTMGERPVPTQPADEADEIADRVFRQAS